MRLGPRLRAWTESGDLVQETLRAAFLDLRGGWEGELDLLDRLARIAMNRIRDLEDHLHAQRRDVRRVLPLGAGEGAAASAACARPAPLDPGPGVSEEAFLREVRAILDETVASLVDEYREVILLRDYQGASWEEVARALGRDSVHGVQQLHQRAWIKVRGRAAPRLKGLGA